MNILFDTSFLCALHNKSDAHHREALQQFKGVMGKTKTLIPAIVIAEYLIGDTNTQSTIDHWKQLCGSFLPVTEREIQELAKLPHSLRKKLRANDCLVLIHAAENHALLFTFDQNLNKAYGEMSAT